MKKSVPELSRRERQIMNIIYQNGQATAVEIREQLPDPPSYSTVRALLAVLEKKGHLKHKVKGPRYIYHPTLAREKIKHSALQNLMQTFFDNSTERVVAALMDISGSELSDEEFEKLTSLIEQARKEGK